MFGQGKLDEDSVHGGIGIEVFDCTEEFLLRHVLGVYCVREFDIGLAVGIRLRSCRREKGTSCAALPFMRT